MKNNSNYLVLILFTACFTYSCHWLKKQPKTPEEVTLKFVRALEVMDLDLAASCCDSATSILFEQFQASLATMSVETRKENVAKMKLIQQSTCEISNNTASCVLCCGENNQNIPERLSLRLVDNQWFISLVPNAEASETEGVASEPPTEVTEEPIMAED